MENDMMLRKNCNAKLHAGFDSRSVKKKKNYYLYLSEDRKHLTRIHKIKKRVVMVSLYIFLNQILRCNCYNMKHRFHTLLAVLP